jgi:hypothetical protein
LVEEEQQTQEQTQTQPLAAEAAAVADQEPLEAVQVAVTRAARWRAFAERQERAFHVLVLTCVIFGVAAAAFAWTTLRVHDREASAENKERDVARVLSAADVRSAKQPVRGGGNLTAYYSPALGQATIVEYGMHTPTGGRTYSFWYVDASGTTRPAGSSRFDHPRNDLVLASVPAATQLEITLEPSAGSDHPTTPALATLSLG